MTATSPRAFLLSATLHGGVIAVLLLFTYVLNRESSEKPVVFELVAGEGDNYMAKEAPALGTPGGVKIDVPKMPEARPAPPEPVPQQAAPPTPAPTPKTVTPPKEQTTPDFKKKFQRDMKRAEAKAKAEIKKEREAEAKRVAAEEAKRAEEQKRLTKEEFDRTNKTKATTTPSKSAPPKVAKIDAEGIAKGVVGGSANNKVGGAGGKALVSNNDDVLGAYYAMFKQRLRAEFEAPPGLSDSLQATVELQSHADGSLGAARIVRSSGSAEFDRAVLDAIRRVRMPPRPDRKGESIEFVFTMRERNEG